MRLVVYLFELLMIDGADPCHRAGRRRRLFPRREDLLDLRQGHADAVDERGDIYSLGVIFYEMLTGERPFVAATPMAVIYKHSHADIPALPESLAAYQELVNTLLAKDPADRYQSADALLAVLSTTVPERV